MFNIISIILGFILLIKSADFLVDGASKIAKKFNIPEIVIGLTIVAIGTSMPELVVSLTSAIEGHSDLAIGNVVGSNMANMFLILGICSIIKPLTFKRETKVFELPFTIFVTAILYFICVNDKIIVRKEGVTLLVLCLIYFIYNFIMAKKGNEFDNENTLLEIKTKNLNESSMLGAIFKIILGAVGLKIGGDLVVNGSVSIAKQLQISEKLISLTIVAFSTSLPELITSITATKKGDTDIAIGNVIGSQILNILLIIGVSATVNPIAYSNQYNSNIILLIIGSIVLASFPFFGEKFNKMNRMIRTDGILFCMVYVVYMMNIIVAEVGVAR